MYFEYSIYNYTNEQLDPIKNKLTDNYTFLHCN